MLAICKGLKSAREETRRPIFLERLTWDDSPSSRANPRHHKNLLVNPRGKAKGRGNLGGFKNRHHEANGAAHYLAHVAMDLNLKEKWVLYPTGLLDSVHTYLN